MAEMLERLRNMVMSASELNLRVFFERPGQDVNSVLAFLIRAGTCKDDEIKLFQKETFGDIVARGLRAIG
jgi:hypothetical protein